MSYFDKAQEIAPWITGLRRYFHEHPEPSLEEYHTAARIEAELEALGIEHRRVGETGVAGFIQGEKPGRGVIALRADIDALRIQDTKSTAYRSINAGILHACGHDAHAAALLGAARLLQESRASFGGEVRLLFQQAEEIGAGAKQFIRAGLLQDVGRVFGIHVASDIPVGSVALRGGPLNASVDHFTITVQGKAAHVATPYKGADALFAASSIVVALQSIVTRQTDPVDSIIIGVGKLSAGSAYNIVAEQAVLEGTTRTFSPETRRFVNKQIEKTATSIASLYGAAATIEWEDFASPLVNNDLVAQETGAIVATHLGTDKLVTTRSRALGGDDFAEFLLEVPGAYAYIGSGNPDKPGTTLPHHNGGFDIDEDALPIGAALYAEAALQWLTK